MTFFREFPLHFPGMRRHGTAQKAADASEGVVFNQELAKARSNADELWEKSYAQADSWTTQASHMLTWDHINKPVQFDSDAVVASLGCMIAESEAQKLKSSAATHKATIDRLKFNYGSQVADYERLYPEEHTPLAAHPELYEEHMATVRQTAAVIMDIFKTSSGDAQKNRIKYELPGLLHQLPYIRGKAVKREPQASLGPNALKQDRQ